VQQDGSAFPVADKLIQVAGYYGFDGWFINQETAGGDSALANQMRDFMKYIQSNSDLNIMWYDAMTESGSISWQNALNSANDMYFQDESVVSDEMFLNFWWTSNNLMSSAAFADVLGRSPYDLYAGVDVQANGYNTSVNWNALFPEGADHTTSLGFYCPNWCFSNSSSHNDFYQKANRFWVGPNGDPSNTTTTSSWKGMAHYVPAQSTIDDLPFVTNFNTGQGYFYAIDGQFLQTGTWNNRSLQDVLPTWRWIAESGGTSLYPELDWSDAYYGGTCLKVSGDLNAANTTHLKLFKTRLTVTSDVNLTIVYKTGSSGEPSHMKVGLAFEDDPGNFQFFEVGAATSPNWNTKTFGLSAYSGRTIAVISLKFEADTSESDYSIRIGRIGLTYDSPTPPSPPSGVFVDNFQLVDAYRATIRLKWDHSSSAVYAYNIYRVNPDGRRTLLGGTPNNAYFVAEINRAGDEQRTTIEVEAVGMDFIPSSADTTSVFWGSGPANNPPVAMANGPYYGVTGETVGFSSNGSHDTDGSVVSYFWTFGDGGTSTNANPTHAYASEGNYTVTLTVADDDGAPGSDTTAAVITDTPQDLSPQAGWWMLDETEGSMAHDSSGNGNDGIVAGALWTEGVLNGALDFDGSYDFVLVGNYPKPDSVMTATAWAYARSRPTWASMVKNWASATGAFHLGLRDSQGDLEVQVTEADGDVVSTREGPDTPFPLDSWQHVAMVADGSRIRLYRNGTQIADVGYDGTLKTSRDALGIGMKPNDAGTGPDQAVPGYWDGMLDDVRLYDRVLNPIEILDLYSEGATDIAEHARLSSIPMTFALKQNHPNPFNLDTEIWYQIPEEAHVVLKIHNVAGQEIVSLVDADRRTGRHSAPWDGRDARGREVSAGIYFCTLRTGQFSQTIKMVLLK
jgi:hypothetical protein